MQEHMTEAEIDSLTKHLYKQIDESTSISGYENKVIETVYTTIANDIFVLEVNELTQEEYNQKQKNIQSRGSFHQTSSKQISILVSPINSNTSRQNVTIQNVWKKIPVNKSFDVIALRWQNTVRGTVKDEYSGFQEYKEFTQQVNPGNVVYSQSSGNFKTALHGVGLSQNLVNGEYYYVNLLNVKVSCTGTVNFYGTYQHARGSLTLTDSQNYSFGSSGYGNVLEFGGPGVSMYDQMAGVSSTIVCN